MYKMKILQLQSELMSCILFPFFFFLARSISEIGEIFRDNRLLNRSFLWSINMYRELCF